MINPKLYFSDRNVWSKFEDTYMRGGAYLGERLISVSSISALLAKVNNFADFLSLISKLNGFFAIIHKTDDSLFLAVDRVRSMPLFYSELNEQIYISDSSELIRKKLDYTEIDELSAIEFLLTGYVTGNSTLSPNIKQLQAGEALIINYNDNEIKVSVKRYYRYIHSNYSRKSSEELLSELDDVLLRVFRRLVIWTKGKTIVVPLSGGYDSRLIVFMLKRLGYDKVIAFTYGQPGNNESDVSRNVANSLNIQWEFVPYNPDAWSKWYQSSECQEYCKYSFNLCSSPLLQDWPAISILKKKLLIPEDSVIVPGLSADLLAGSRSFAIPELYLPGQSNKCILEIIYNYHYNLWDVSKFSCKDLHHALRERIKISLDSEVLSQDAAGIFESWDVQERQAKFINNSVRAYDFWGYQWWLPFWDLEFMDFWSRVPIAERIGEILYKTYVDNLTREIYNVDGAKSKERPLSNRLVKKVKKLLIQVPFSKDSLDAFLYHRRFSQYENHPLAWYGIISKEKFRELYTGRETIDSFIVLDMIRELAPRSDCIKRMVLSLDPIP